MASWQQTVQRAARHLREMTLSQRLAVLLGAVLIAVSLAWLANWAASPQMVPLLPQPLTAAEMGEVESGLATLNEPYEVYGSQVYVRASTNKNSLLAKLHQAGQLPSDTSLGFQKLIDDANPWISTSESDRRWTVALQNELAAVIREFNGVGKADVVLNVGGKQRGFTRTEAPSSASITIFMDGGEPVPRNLAVAAAKWVVGAVRGLKRENVEVIDGGTGRVAVDWADESQASLTKLHKLRKEIEQDTEGKIRDQLNYDPHVKVSVSVELDHSMENVQDTIASEGPLVQENRETLNTTRNRRANQPGVQPNTGMEVGTGNTVDATTEEKTESTFMPGTRTSTTQTPPGRRRSISAAISLSYTYLRRVFEMQNPDADAPGEEDIEEVFQARREQITQHLARLMIPPEPEQVSVLWHYDALEAPTVVQAETWELSVETAQKWAPTAGLGLLALFALFMVGRMARNSDAGESFGLELGLSEESIEAARRAAEDLSVAQSIRDEDEQDEQADGPPAAIPFPLGEMADSVLDAPELDESTMQITQMLEQVAKMTETDAEAIAGIVESWVERGD